MSSRSFRSVFMVASCAGAALSCYLVSLRVASERAALEDVETRIVVAQRDMRVLQTEIGTRGRLSQLERWNAGAFALSAPSAGQFLKGSFELARLAQPERKVDFQAPVVLASAPAPAARPQVGAPETDDSGVPQIGRQPSSLLHEASLSTETREIPARQIATLPRARAGTSDKPATTARPAQPKSPKKSNLAAAERTRPEGARTAKEKTAKEKTASKKTATNRIAEVSKPRSGKPMRERELAERTRTTAQKSPSKLAAVSPRLTKKKSVDKTADASARPVTKLVRLAKVDPLAPLPARHSGHSKDVSAD